MKAVERRLLREFPVVRRHLVVATALAGVGAAVVVAQAVLLADVLTAGASVVPLVGVFVARAALVRGQEVLAERVAAAVRGALTSRLLAHTQALGPVVLGRQRHGEVATLVTRGLDGLDRYVTGYLPRFAAAAVVPIAVLVALVLTDPASALVVLVTVPLVPIFGVLVGTHTRRRTARQWRLLSRLGGHFLDVVTGLPTLRAFGRDRSEADVVRRMADRHRRATTRTLRVAFLSSLVLELVTALSVAVVAVPLGLRLLTGSVGLDVALVVLFLAPEAYLPLRAAGAAFHDGAEGVAVAEQAFALLDLPVRSRGTASPRGAGLALDGVTVRYPDREDTALSGFSLAVRPGERVALVGPSGVGKSTVLALLLGFAAPESGRVLVGDVDLADVDLDRWRADVAWVPQHPHLFAVSVADNIRLGRPGASDAEVRAAARAAAVEEFVLDLPEGYETVLGERGAGLSEGQRRRIALARAFLRDAPVLLLDEPTAHLDPASEAAVVAASARLMAGRTVLVVAHRPAVLEHVDRLVPVPA